jgi:hypothetical protein
MTDTLIHYGGALKTLDDSGRVGGRLVTFGGKDLDGEEFTAETYYGARSGDGADCLFHHMLPVKGVAPELADHIFSPIKATKDEVGIFAETVLNLADDYEKKVHDLVKAGKLGWSSGAPEHTVRKSADGVIERWIIAEASFTPTPAEPRNRVLSLKTYQAGLDAPPLPAIKGLFKDKLSEQTPSWWQFQNIFCDVAKDIANAARSSRVTGVAVDVAALVRDAFNEYADLLVPVVVAQIEDFAQDSGDEYFYLKSATLSGVEPSDALPFADLALAAALKSGRRNSARDLELINNILRAAKELVAEEDKPTAEPDALASLLSRSRRQIADLEVATL